MTVCMRGNRCVKIFATDFGWSFFFPTKLKSEVHEALSLLFQQGGVPPAVKYDNAEEMFLSEFSRKVKEASCHLR